MSEFIDESLDKFIYVNPSNKVMPDAAAFGLMTAELVKLKEKLKKYPEEEELTQENSDIQLERARVVAEIEDLTQAIERYK